MGMLADAIASVFFSWGGEAAGKRVFRAPPDLKGREIMVAFEGFLRDNPKMASEPYGAAMAATMSEEFSCQVE
ncbi:MAG TPA: hypothetical protein VJY34_16920 [Roseiarcus sp.]|nr:hypothetical protein [Roseiarcus sp.]